MKNDEIVNALGAEAHINDIRISASIGNLVFDLPITRIVKVVPIAGDSGMTINLCCSLDGEG